MPQLKTPIALIAASATLLSLSAQASIITEETLTGTGSLGEYSAHFSWDGSALEINLTNLSEPNNGGFITGLLLNLPHMSDFDSASTDTSLVSLMPDSGPYNGAPYGSYDYGYALGGNFLGGGNPNGGIGIGETGHFEFTDWSGAENFDVADFFNNLATLETNDTQLVVRFKGFEDGGSDKVPGVFNPPPVDEPPPPPPEDEPPPPLFPPPPPNLEVSTPSTLWLILLAGLGGVFMMLRRRKSK